MLGVKRLYRYVLSSFLPVFVAAFLVSVFILLMIFIWQYVADFVGKGLDILVMGELFLYASLNLVPTALPLATLVASLIAFGNMTETLELTAMKASGISLLKVMKPLIIMMVLLSISVFFFQDKAVPVISGKFRTLLISIRMKSPELDIPEGSFYAEMPNYSIFVKHKDKETGVLREVMIYDISKGFNNIAVIVCDSAKMKMASSKEYVVLNLYYGQQFANFKQGSLSSPSKFTAYSRENFREKQILISFDGNFNRMDESMMDGSQAIKNISELRHSVDSLQLSIDSMNVADRKSVKYEYLSYRVENKYAESEPAKEEKVVDVDSLLATYNNSQLLNIYNSALQQTESTKSNYMFKSSMKSPVLKNIRLHEIELQRKFTLSIACIIFFFIGAPLGSIIGKGGLGVPTVVSLILFIFYYMIDNVGRKMARDGVWDVWFGIWMSSFILLPLGIFFTYKAINDSAIFNAEAYRKVLVRVKALIETVRAMIKIKKK